MITSIILAAALAQATFDPRVIDPQVNQGNVAQTICRPGGWTDSVRNVKSADRKQAFALAGIDPKVGGPWIVDHHCSLELGCSNVLPNLMIQNKKDSDLNNKLENRLHMLVCKGQVTLDQARHDVWYWRPSMAKYGLPSS